MRHKEKERERKKKSQRQREKRKKELDTSKALVAQLVLITFSLCGSFYCLPPHTQLGN